MSALRGAPREARVPLVAPHWLIVRTEPVTVDTTLTTLGVFAVHCGPDGEYRQLVSAALTLRQADGAALLAALTAAGFGVPAFA